MTNAFYSKNPKTIPVGEMEKVWKVELRYKKEHKCVVAYINLAEVKNYGDYVSETTELFSDTTKAIKICAMNRLNNKKLDSMQEKINLELPNRLETIFNHTSETRTQADLICTAVWNILPEEA